jgi:hypothetical protein
MSLPANCIVERWCVVSATSCVFTYMLHPNGLEQAEAQYSVVRRGVARCDLGFGQWSEQEFTTPVEPVIFRSGIETEKATAQSEALRLCSTYRDQWISAAPSCPSQY